MTLLLEDDLLVRLLARGLVTLQDLRDMEEDLAQARTLVMAGGGEQRRITWLLQKGMVSRENLEAARADAPAPAGRAVPPGPPVRDRSTADRMARSRYRVMELLGEGGMGKVYKAHDRKLDRYVALKFLYASDPEMIQRFQREAQAQARIEHPAICKVFEVGELDGRPYIAMQHINGRTLKAARSEMTLEQKVQVIRMAAEAMHEAHRTGLIHRDLNPSNIMVERSDSGAWIPYLMDFGLAKELAGPGLTQDGTAAGTPFYMSPEQAAGDIQKLDRRTDIYALGATLYELLSGAPPFDGASVFEILEQVVRSEAVPLRRRDPSLPADLEIIIMKCLEKEPQRRYDSARALAEDLGRYLDGEPVRARPASILYRLRKKAGKYKLAVGIGGTALLALLAVSSLWLGERWAARERAALAQRFGQEVQELESVLRYAHMMPLHDITPEKRQVESRMASIRERMDSLGGIARGPGYYALGRGHLALDRSEEALKDLLVAWNEGVREPAVAAALGRAFARVYQERLPGAEGIRNPELRAAKVKELDERFRQPALEHLKLGREATSDAPEYGEALLALLDRRWDEVVSLAAKARARVPWLYEAYRLEEEAFSGQARAMEGRGRFDEAQGLLGRAQIAIGRALEMAPSDPALYVAQVRLHSSRMRLAEAQGLPVEEAYRDAVSVVRTALIADADSVAAYDALLYAEWKMGANLQRSGRDPNSAFLRAEDAARKALALDPKEVGVLNGLGLTFASRGEWEWDNGRDPVASFVEARKWYGRAAALDPGNAVVLNNLGNAHLLLGDYGRGRGRDPAPWLKRAVEAYETALRIQPESAYLHSNLGNAWASIGESRMERGEDPTASLTTAEHHHREALRLNPQYALGWTNLGYDLMDQARWAAKSGGDPVPFFIKALEAYAAGIGVNPSSSTVHLNSANAHLDWAEWQVDHGVDPREHLDQAGSLLDRSLELNAVDAYAHASRGIGLHLAARWASALDQDPRSLLREAEAAHTRAAAIDPGYAAALRERGAARLARAVAGPAGRDRALLLEEAVDDLGRALKLNPSDALARAALAGVLLARGNPAGALGEARKAREQDPLDPEIASRLGLALAAAGEPLPGLAILREALERRQGSISLLLALAEVEAARGPEGVEGCREAAGAVLKAMPRHPRALALLRTPGPSR